MKVLSALARIEQGAGSKVEPKPRNKAAVMYQLDRTVFLCLFIYLWFT
jgi:hypothetical protein